MELCKCGHLDTDHLDDAHMCLIYGCDCECYESEDDVYTPELDK